MGISTRSGGGKPSAGKKLTKEQLTLEIARAVGAGKAAAVETVDFADPNRPKVCLEVDFPILPINQIAAIEGNAGKPIYQMSKWWARRRSSVFRSLLISAAMKAPDDPAEAAKAVWDVYYNNHQKKGALKHLKVADIFMGGGTTLVEGSRLGMEMLGTDLNPVAWLVVKNELANVNRAEVELLLATVEAEVKPQLMPFYACDCPRGHRGTWTRVSTDEVMGASFNPLALAPAARSDFRYQGPEITYVFWVKHGTCHVTGCGHRTPLMPSPIVSSKILTVRAWCDHECRSCSGQFDVEDADARMAPGSPLVVGEEQGPYAVLDAKGGVTCPHCSCRDAIPQLLGKPARKKIVLTLLADPSWLLGAAAAIAPSSAKSGLENGSLSCWHEARARDAGIFEFRGELPADLTAPSTGQTLDLTSGPAKGRGVFACGACGVEQRFTESTQQTGKCADIAALAIQGFCPSCQRAGLPYSGRYFAPVTDARATVAAESEWASRSVADLDGWWPTSEIPFGHETHQRQPLPQQGFTHWWKMFNPRQLLVHSCLLRAIVTTPMTVSWTTREYALGAFQQYLRNNNLFAFWNPQRDTLEPHFSNNNYHPKSVVVENSVFPSLGRGNWQSCSSALVETLDWAAAPWELVSAEGLRAYSLELASSVTGKSERVLCHDPVASGQPLCESATNLESLANASFDLVITDPPFGDNVQYAELGDFFYVWLRLALKDRYPEYFSAAYCPKTLEAVTNKARHAENPDAFYQRLLTECWREAHRVLKPGGLLAFTFHHSEDEPWVAVLESLFDAGFYLEATYPIRSDETKGDGQFGSRLIEYDIIHVCRKRTDEPTSVSWARMRKRVLDDVRQLQTVLENHAAAGLPSADLKVIKRGKALEYYSRHYGKVYVDEGRPFSVRDALVGINQLLDEEPGGVKEPPPGNSEPFTRQYLSLFRGVTEQPRDQVQKDLRGTGYSPSELVERGWCTEERKTFYVKEPRSLAAEWYKRHRRNLTSDYDQAAFLIGASSDGSGINVRETLTNENFRPHPALKALLDWHTRNGATKEVRAAAQRALAIYAGWEQQNPAAAAQLTFFAE
jgi:putative DNA methylase